MGLINVGARDTHKMHRQSSLGAGLMDASYCTTTACDISFMAIIDEAFKTG